MFLWERWRAMIQVKWNFDSEKKSAGEFWKISVQFIDYIFCNINLHRWEKNQCSNALGNNSYFALYLRTRTYSMKTVFVAAYIKIFKNSFKGVFVIGEFTRPF